MEKWLERLNETKDENIKVVEDNYVKLKEYCEKDSNLARFVELMLLQDYYRKDPDCDLGNHLSMLVYTLGWAVERNSLHNTDTLSVLTNFIGNCFFDDTCFYITENEYGEKVAKVEDGTDQELHQSPIPLLEAAQHNLELMKKRMDAFRNRLRKE